MGIGFHELCFLSFCLKEKEPKTLATIGRQENHINFNQYKKIFNKDIKHLIDEKYSDNLLKAQIGLSKIESFDVSSKDNPSKISDFNKNLKFLEKFDVFFDGGSLQNIFNIPVALKNISNNTKIGGTIIHVTAANNFCGLGFYQFAPEFFLNYYSEENGFKNTKIFVVNCDQEKYWFQLNNKNHNNYPINVNTTERLLCLVKTEKIEDKEIKSIFQKQFMHDSKDKQTMSDSKNNNVLKKILGKIYFKVILLVSFICRNCQLNANPNFKKIKISDLI
jgi:hypothetical protein